MRQRSFLLSNGWLCAHAILFVMGWTLCATNSLFAQTSSVSAWEAADFRSWSFIPYWTSQSQLNSFATDRVYDHLSDILYFSGVKPREDGSLSTSTTAANHLATLKNHQAQFGFRYHMSMFDVVANSGESSSAAVERVWNGITSNPTTRATFVNNVKNLLTANNMTGFNLDWERPNTVTEWANYTQLAKDMQAAFPESWEVSVDDYGFASSLWDDTPVFDARTYDQIGMMGYHYPANNGTSLDQQSFADGKKALTGQGAEKAFKDSQIIIGMGTWGDNGPSTIGLKDIVAANPNLPADASSFTGTVNGVTGTWDIVSRYEVRDNVQLALDRGMAGVMWWALHYEPTNKMSLARVAQHYAMFKRGVPDLNLDGKVNAADANTLANNMGTVPGWTGTNTPARFETFYMNGNWEKGDRDGNGFVNQADADWLAAPLHRARRQSARPARLHRHVRKLPERPGPRRSLGRHPQRRQPAGDRQLHAARRQLPRLCRHRRRRRQAQQHCRHAPQSERRRSLRLAQHPDRVMRVDLADADRSCRRTKRRTSPRWCVRTPAAARRPARLDRSHARARIPRRRRRQSIRLRALRQPGAVRHPQPGRRRRRRRDSADGFAANATYLLVGKICGNGAGAEHAAGVAAADGWRSIGNFTNPAFPWMLTARVERRLQSHDHRTRLEQPVCRQLHRQQCLDRRGRRLLRPAGRLGRLQRRRHRRRRRLLPSGATAWAPSTPWTTTTPGSRISARSFRQRQRPRCPSAVPEPGALLAAFVHSAGF